MIELRRDEVGDVRARRRPLRQAAVAGQEPRQCGQNLRLAT